MSPRTTRVFAAAVFLILIALAAVVISQPAPVVSPKFPSDIPGGAPNASLPQAAAFAWQEFIAATWPAQRNASGSYNRDTPDPNGVYGATAASATGAPLVWETFRHKVEIFPGTTTTSYLTTQLPHGANLSLPDYGYNDPPQYQYGNLNLGTTSQVPAVTGPCNPKDPLNKTTAWVNADENSQIFLDTMYAGVLGGGPQPTSAQEILFLAKGNRTQFMYVVNPANAGAPSSDIHLGLWNHGASGNNNPRYTTAVNHFITYQTAVLSGKPATLTAPYVSFPAGTIEAKSAWRPLSGTEAASGRFHMTVVRTYRSTGSQGQACWVQQPWGMLALHIIQKTPTAPYFIYATFSQADNITNASGQSIEDADGNVIRTPVPPTGGSSLDAGKGTIVKANLAQANGTNETYNVTTAQCQPGTRLYLVNSTGPYTPQGPICVNERAHAIPKEIINANKVFHAAIARYNQSHGLKSTPWLYYKLVNVQAKPINKQPGVLYTGPDAATFYQSNDVVETNYNLQFFSGRLVDSTGGQLMSDYATSSTAAKPVPFENVFYLKTKNGSSVATYNMGGCMGCHGNAQQSADDFSFILNVGRNDAPETLPPPSTPMHAQAAAVAAKVRKFNLPHH
jgi:hypothetical protein